MASDIAELCNAIAQVDMSFVKDNGETLTINAISLTNSKTTVANGETPVRLIFPPGTIGDGLQSQVRNGHNVSIVWEITDLMLFAPVATTANLGGMLYLQAQYMANYLFKLPILSEITAVNGGVGYIESTQPTIGIYEFPQGGNVFYHGVQVAIGLRENLTIPKLAIQVS